jgi:hypothetical protein
MIRPLRADDLQQLPPLWAASHSRAQATDLQHIAEDAARLPGGEHRAIVSADEHNRISGIALFRTVAGAVGTGELEGVAAADPALAKELLGAAVGELRSEGARLVVAEYQAAPQAAWYAALLQESGFIVQARISDYFGDGVPLVISALGA